MESRCSYEQPRRNGTSSRYIIRAIEDECLALAQAAEGERNERLNRSAYSLARFVASGQAHAEPIIRALSAAAAHTGLPDHEIEKTINSAFSSRGVST